MNLLLFEDADRIDEHHIRLSGRRLQHLQEIHRAEAGHTLRVGEIDGLVGVAEVEDISTHCATLRVQLQQHPPGKLPVTLVLALPRPKMLRRILRSTAEFGVRELHLINSYRVEKSFWQTPVLHNDSIREYLLLGLEQARDTKLPPVYLHRRFKPWVEDEFPQLTEGKRVILAHPGEHPVYANHLPQETLLIVGPEGGFIPFEVEQFRKSGCETVSLGPRILRVENAVSALLGRLL